MINIIKNTVTEKERKKKMATKTTEKTPDSSRILGNEKRNKVPFAVVEAYKTTRIHIVSTLEKSNSKIFAISSPNAAEGKSTTAINVAIALSQLNKKVLIIDADSRRSTIHKKLKTENGLGLLDIISGTATIEECVRDYNNNMKFLTSGTQANNPSELYSTDSFSEFLDNVKDMFDYIIFDTPPINLVSDALVIAQKCDGIILVARANITTYDAFKRTVDSTKELNINVFGVIINGYESEKSYKYGKYSRYGKYGYGRYSGYGRYGYYRYRNSYYSRPSHNSDSKNDNNN